MTKVSFSQQVRDVLKSGPNRPIRIAEILGSTGQKVQDALRENRKSGNCISLGDGMYEFVRDPVPKTTMPKAERSARQAAYRKRKAEEAGREYVSNPMKARKESKNKQYTVIKPKEVVEMGSFQTVDDWLKNGGVIDRSPTSPKFERLTAEDIAKFKYRPRSAGTISGGRSYLAG